MAVEVEKLLVTLQADIGQYQRNLQASQAQTNRTLAAMEGRFAVWSRNLKQSSSTAAMGMTSAFAGLGAVLGASTVIDYANAWTRVTRSIDASGRVFGVALRPATELNNLANDARVDLEAYSKLYIRTAAAIRDYGFEAGTAEKVTSTLAKALKLGGAAASEQASVLLQFSQALQKGKLDGDEFRSVMENAGVVQELLADRLRVTKGEIVKMAADGKLQIIDLVGAMVDGGERVDRIFRQMPATIDEAYAVLRNNVIQFLGEADKASGASAAIADGLVTISKNLDAIAVVAGALLGSAALRMTAFAAATVAASNPVTLLAAGIGALVTGYTVLGDKVPVSRDGLISLQGAMSAFIDVISGQDEVERFNASLDRMTEAQRNAAIAAQEHADSQGVIAGTLDAIEQSAQLAINALYELGQTGKQDGGPMSAWIEGTKELASWIGRVTGLSALATAGLDTLDAAAERARTVAMQKGIEQANLGQGLQNYRDGKISDRRPMPKATDTNAKRSEYERDVDQIKKRTAALQAEVATIGQSEFAQNKAKAAAELRFAATQTAAKEGRKVSAEEIAAIEKLSDAYAGAQAQASFLNRLQSERQGIDEARQELELVGLYGQELDAARRKLELLNAAKRLGVTLTPEREQEIEATANARAGIDDYQRKIEDLKQSSADALKGFISDLREGKSATEALGKALENLADKLINTGLDQLVTSLIGGSAQPGGLLSGLLGGPAATTTGWNATVTRFAAGGYVSGPGTSRSDSIAARLSNGEFVVNADATAKNRQTLEAINSGRIPKFADGGIVGVPSMPTIPKLAAQAPAQAVSLTIAPVFQVQNGTPEGVKTMQDVTLPQLQKVIRAEIGNVFDRNNRFARSGV